MPPKCIEFSDTEAAEIERRYLSGECARDIGVDFFCSPSPIYRILRKRGVNIRRGGSRKRLTEDDFEYMDWLYWGLGWSQKEIGEALNIKGTTVSSRFTQNGIPTRSRAEINRRVWARLSPEERRERGQRMWAGLSDEEKQRQKQKLAHFSREQAERLRSMAAA